MSVVWEALEAPYLITPRSGACLTVSQVTDEPFRRRHSFRGMKPQKSSIADDMSCLPRLCIILRIRQRRPRIRRSFHPFGRVAHGNQVSFSRASAHRALLYSKAAATYMDLSHIGKGGDETGMPATIRDTCCNAEGRSPIGA